MWKLYKFQNTINLAVNPNFFLTLKLEYIIKCLLEAINDILP